MTITSADITKPLAGFGRRGAKKTFVCNCLILSGGCKNVQIFLQKELQSEKLFVYLHSQNGSVA